jgi:hypothetical protein
MYRIKEIKNNDKPILVGVCYGPSSNLLYVLLKILKT